MRIPKSIRLCSIAGLPIFICGCFSEGGYDKCPMETGDFIMSLSDSHKIFTYRDKGESPFLQDALSEIDSTYTGFMYIVDGGCSFCIGTMVEFLGEMRTKRCVAPICIVVDERFVCSVQYYVEEVFEDCEYAIWSFKHTQTQHQIEEDGLNGVFYDVRSGMLHSAFIYVGDQQR